MEIIFRANILVKLDININQLKAQLKVHDS